MELPVGSWESADLLLAREGLGLTQAELAAAIGYDRSAIAKIEGGDVAPRRVVELAIRYLIDRRPQGARFEIREPENSRFRPPGTAIGINEGFLGGASVEVHLASGPAIWLRLLPGYDSGRRWLPVELKKVATQSGFPLVQLVDGYADLGFVRGADGFGVYALLGGDRANTPAVSFIFETGEIWSVDTYIIDAVKRDTDAGVRRGIPYLEDRFKFAIHSFRILFNRLELHSPLQWVAGVEGIEGCGIYYPAPAGHYFPIPVPYGPALKDRVYETGVLNEDDTPASALKPFFKKLFGAFNIERPDYLDALSNPK
jgi:transcriptional regulator with XRE-family HTH domain